MISQSCLQVVPKLSKSCTKFVDKLFQSCTKVVSQLLKVVPKLSKTFLQVLSKFSPWVGLGLGNSGWTAVLQSSQMILLYLHFYVFWFYPETLWRDWRHLGRRRPDGVVPKLLQSCSKLVQKLSPSCSKVFPEHFGVTGATWVAAILTECDSAPSHLAR